MRLEDSIQQHFKCAKCELTDAVTKRFSATGTGLSKLLDIQHDQFLAVSCSNCGYTELYNPDILEKRGNLGTILDTVFGG